MDRISEIMNREHICCLASTKLEESKSLMEKYHCTKIPVIDKNQRIIGGIGLSDLQEGYERVVECMTKDIKVVEMDSTEDECLRLMIINDLEQIPVIDKQGHFCGMVTQRQLLKH